MAVSFLKTSFGATSAYSLKIFIGIFLFFVCEGNIYMQNISSTLGIFEATADIGRSSIKGSVNYDAEHSGYTITGSGNNIWNNEDEFFFVWKRVEGDLFLSAEIDWIGSGKNEHRKAGWMIRAGLDVDDPYVDAVLHGDGLLSMQYRITKGGQTAELKIPLKIKAALMLEKTGDQFTFGIKKSDGAIINAGTITLPLKGLLYAGLAVCSHDSKTSETAVFSNVNIKMQKPVLQENRIIESTLEIIEINTGIRTVIRRAKEHFEAPNWSRNGKYLIYNSDGKLYRLSTEGGSPELINTSFADKCNNDHGLSPDGDKIAISHHSDDGKSRIYILPAVGGEPKLLTSEGPSYWHGWSPDGRELAYCAERNGEFDVYSISVDGGDETRLTNAPGLDDGPDYSPDGKHIFFNSFRTGQMKIWRMNTDGSDQVQWTPDDNYGDWFPHPSPDGNWIVFVSYNKDVEGHPPNKDVVLRIMELKGGDPKILAVLFGGQGTINVPSWSPDSKKIAFVSYRLLSE